MNRDTFLQALDAPSAEWDVLVIGGGATGLGTAVEAAARGYRTLLVDQADFAAATSSRSTKLIHGGVRYLRQGDVSLVRESLRERGRLLRNAPHLVRPLPFLIPNYHWWEGPYYGVGLKLYDRLAGRLGIEPTRMLSAPAARDRIPTLVTHHLAGGVLYHDAQFDDARLALALAQTAAALGAVPLNYTALLRLHKSQGRVAGALLRDLESGTDYEVKAKSVINATGIFTDAIRHMDDAQAAPLMTVSQGIHLVLPARCLPGSTALMIPKTEDGRVLFAIPWQGHVLLGTTDTPVAGPELEPRPQSEEIDYLLAHAARYLSPAPVAADVRAVFAGLRPLVTPTRSRRTSRISRSHYLTVSDAGLVTITGGKWTTYRQMAEETVDRAAKVGGLEPRPSATPNLQLHGHATTPPQPAHLQVYGSMAGAVEQLAVGPDADPIHPDLPYRWAEVRWAARREMARTLDDALSRRTRILMLHAEAALGAAPRAAAILAEELGRDSSWQEAQVKSFTKLAARYCMPRPA